MYSWDSMSRKKERIPKLGLPIVTNASLEPCENSHRPFEWYVQSLLRYSKLPMSPVSSDHKCASAFSSWHRWKKLHCNYPLYPPLSPTRLYSAGITDAKPGSWKKLLACGAAKRKRIVLR